MRRMIPAELRAACGLCSPPRASGIGGMDLNTEKEHVWKLSVGGGLWLATHNHVKWTKKYHQNTEFFHTFPQLQTTRALFLLSVQGVLNRQRYSGLKDAPVFPSFVNLRAVKGSDAFTWGNHSSTLLSSFAIVILLLLLLPLPKSWC